MRGRSLGEGEAREEAEQRMGVEIKKRWRRGDRLEREDEGRWGTKTINLAPDLGARG